MSRTGFYEKVAADLFRGSLPDWQREPLDRLIDEGLARERTLEETSYVLATAYHETGRFKHMEEIGQGEGRDYGAAVTTMRGRRQSYHGRGFVQITWLENYAEASIWTGVNLIRHPDRAMEPEIASKIIWEGMIRGSFTGKNLADYIGAGQVDYVNARRIVNGTDRAEEIAEYARKFEAALGLITPDTKPQSPCGRAGCPYEKDVA